ncbi:hypothetical protein [uncultured Tessaracoccus sp.]|uniref:LppU/SCO3897 family protein n=1 Tax=uncultured Tessaracoccus sp. TaxID=905023 RepID=UPI0025E6CB7B|nr:hypothetical protein [uncultured Tessaracoccus sp.]
MTQHPNMPGGQTPFGSQGQPPGQPWPPRQGQPYPHQPGPQFGQQPGQPQPPHQGQQPGHQPGQQRRTGLKRVKAILSVLVFLAVVLVAVSTLWSRYKEDQTLAVGTCVTVSGAKDDPTFADADCDTGDQFRLRVLERGKDVSSCGEGQIEYTSTSRGRRGRSSTTTTCLAPVFEEGKCYKDTDDAAGIAMSPCSEADHKVTKAVDQEHVECEGGATEVAIPAWPRAYCLADPD